MNRDFILTTDASGSAIGYILGQLDDSGSECVIAYGGRALRPEHTDKNVVTISGSKRFQSLFWKTTMIV